jgi:hypothetical protein
LDFFALGGKIQRHGSAFVKIISDFCPGVKSDSGFILLRNSGQEKGNFWVSKVFESLGPGIKSIAD